MFTELENRNHRTAHFEFLPFVVGILGEGSIPRKGRSLPVGDASALTHETVAAIEDICRQATPAFLCRIGWKELDSIDARGVRRRGRIWQTMQDCEPFRYSEAVIDTLLTTYNLLRPPRRDEPSEELPPRAEPPRCDGTGLIGDQLIHHMAMLRFSPLVPEFSDAQIDFFGNNPLNVMARFDFFDAIVGLDELLAGTITRWLPWLGRYWARLWNQLEPNRWARGQQAFHLFNERQHCIFNGWIDGVCAQERLDLLSPLIHYYKDLAEEGGNDWPGQFATVTGKMPRQHRQRFASSHVAALEPAIRIGTLYNQTRGVHPVDREPAQQVFMESFTANDFDQVIETIEAHRDKLLPRIG